MYYQVATDTEAFNECGEQFTPIATLEDRFGFGGKAQIGIDDHCYVLYLRVSSPCPSGCLSIPPDKYRMVKHWFREAFNVLKTLPEPT
jgi:hypothetical protein